MKKLTYTLLLTFMATYTLFSQSHFDYFGNPASHVAQASAIENDRRAQTVPPLSTLFPVPTNPLILVTSLVMANIYGPSAMRNISFTKYRVWMVQLSGLYQQLFCVPMDLLLMVLTSGFPMETTSFSTKSTRLTGQ